MGYDLTVQTPEKSCESFLFAMERSEMKRDTVDLCIERNLRDG